MEISSGWVSAGVTVLTAATAVAGAWIRSAFASRDELLMARAAAQKTLFEKHDVLSKELQEHRLHAAETYVNRNVLKELLIPVERRLEQIEEDLKDSRKDRR